MFCISFDVRAQSAVDPFVAMHLTHTNILTQSFGSLRYAAKVMAFNPFLYSHSLFYFEDKKVEDLELWRPNEFVRVVEASDDELEFGVTGQTIDGPKVVSLNFSSPVSDSAG